MQVVTVIGILNIYMFCDELLMNCIKHVLLCISGSIFFFFLETLTLLTLLLIFLAPLGNF